MSTTKSGKIRIDRAAIKGSWRYEGKWLLETNDETISLKNAALDPCQGGLFPKFALAPARQTPFIIHFAVPR